jgi:acetyl-CoA C-acetyltransferase
MGGVAADAIAHSGVDTREIDGLFVGVMNNGFSKQDFQAALVAMSNDELAHVPAVRVENACATGSAALGGAAVANHAPVLERTK